MLFSHLAADFRPPSSGGQVGPCYTRMVEEVHAALAELGKQECEIAGFYWQQGWNDTLDLERFGLKVWFVYVDCFQVRLTGLCENGGKGRKI